MLSDLWLGTILRLDPGLGRQEGIQLEKQEGEFILISRLLTRRFGLMEPELEASIRQLPLPKLEGLADAMLDFSTITDLVTWIQRVRNESTSGE